MMADDYAALFPPEKQHQADPDYRARKTLAWNDHSSSLVPVNQDELRPGQGRIPKGEILPAVTPEAAEKLLDAGWIEQVDGE